MSLYKKSRKAEHAQYQVEGKSDEECADYAIAEIEKISETVGIPKKLTELGIEEKDFDFEYLSKNALIDACAPGNPFMPTLEETIEFYKELFQQEIRRQCDNSPLIIDISGKIAVKTAQPSLNVL